MGRPSTPFSDDYTTSDRFKLIKREALQIDDRFMMVNFLKCDNDATDTGQSMTGHTEQSIDLLSMSQTE